MDPFEIDLFVQVLMLKLCFASSFVVWQARAWQKHCRVRVQAVDAVMHQQTNTAYATFPGFQSVVRSDSLSVPVLEVADA